MHPLQHIRDNKGIMLWIIFLILGSIIGILNLPEHGLFYPQLINSGHAWVFFLGQFFLLSLILNNQWKPTTALLIAAFSIVLGGLIEILQPLIGRNRSLLDLAYDVLGIAFSTACFYQLYHLKKTKYLLNTLLVFTVLSLTYPGYFAYVTWRLNTTPIILNFERIFESEIIHVDSHVVLEMIDSKDLMGTTGRAGKIKITGGEYPGLALTPVRQDWTKFTYLKVDLVSLMEQPFSLNLRIHDRWHNQEFNDRYNLRHELEPGLNKLIIDLDSIRHGPLDRRLDLTVIENVKLFVSQPRQSIDFIIDNVRLE